MNMPLVRMVRPSFAVAALAVILAIPAPTFAARAYQYLKQRDAWFETADARRIADNILSWQAPAGDWPKNGDTVTQPYRGQTNELHGTFDNAATTGEIRFLARAFKATHDARYRTATLRAIDHILAAQYPNGGWPQYAPAPAKAYPRYITFNDNAMVRLMELMREVSTNSVFAFVGEPRRMAAQEAFNRGIDCILHCQIKVNGKLTVWCAQHDEKDFSPRPARAYELISLSGAESTGILRLLMSLDSPSAEVIRSIKAGAEWFAAAKITGLRQVLENRNKVMVADTSAPPLWARFYEIETGRPFFCGRDGIRKYSIAEIEAERRNGYSWYGSGGEQVAADYAEWSKKWLKPVPKSS